MSATLWFSSAGENDWFHFTVALHYCIGAACVSVGAEEDFQVFTVQGTILTSSSDLYLLKTPYSERSQWLIINKRLSGQLTKDCLVQRRLVSDQVNGRAGHVGRPQKARLKEVLRFLVFFNSVYSWSFPDLVVGLMSLHRCFHSVWNPRKKSVQSVTRLEWEKRSLTALCQRAERIDLLWTWFPAAEPS